MTEPNLINVLTSPKDSNPFSRFPSLGRILSPVHGFLFSTFQIDKTLYLILLHCDLIIIIEVDLDGV